MKTIPYGRQHITKSDIEKVVKVLGSDWITQGHKVSEFENALAKYCGCKYAVAVSSGTAALHLACLAANMKKGDEVVTTPISFLASANSILYTNAKPVFADIDYETINIDPVEINRKINKKTKAILPVHFAGLPCKMNDIKEIAKTYNLLIIEDACHALGAEYKYNGKWIKVGSCKHSDMTVFSFHPVKHITTGEGGAITTNNKMFYERLKVLRNHGIYKDKKTNRKGYWNYEMRDLGFNYRITDFQCALGLSQLERLNDFLVKRHNIAKVYIDNLLEIEDIEVQKTNNSLKHSYHLFVIKLNVKRAGRARRKLYEQLHRLGIRVQVHYIPIHLQPYYRKSFGFKAGDSPVAEDYHKRCISLPLYPELKKKEINFVIDSIKSIII